MLDFVAVWLQCSTSLMLCCSLCYPLLFLSINGTTKHGDEEKEAQATEETTKNKKS